ncbi:hypothetical protein [Streptomyces sp. NPDC006510]|uniref:hypothetical protein n=1 Tax=Streptomyces sp. NPDC006510 TaxID=3155600 RepID=UPI0033BDE40C
MHNEERLGLFTTVAELAVLRAIELAGERITKRVERSHRGPLKSFMPFSVHVQHPTEEGDLDEILPDEAWVIPVAAGLPKDLIEALDRHTRILLAAGLEFRREDLALTLSRLPLEKMALPWESRLPEQ